MSGLRGSRTATSARAPTPVPPVALGSEPLPDLPRWLTRAADVRWVLAVTTLTFSVVGGSLQMLGLPPTTIDAGGRLLWIPVLAHILGNLVSSSVAIGVVLLAVGTRSPVHALNYVLAAVAGFAGGIARIPVALAFWTEQAARDLLTNAVVEVGWFLVAALLVNLVAYLAHAELTERTRLLSSLEAERATRELMLAAEVRLRSEVSEWLHGRLQTELLVAADEVRRLDPRGDRIASRLDAIRESEIRSLARTLHPTLAEIDLFAALQELRSFYAPRGALVLDLPDEAGRALLRGSVDRTRDLATYRLCEEAVSNAFRHGGADQVTLALAVTERSVDINVTDDGSGTQGAPEPGLGLRLVDTWVRAADGLWSLSFPAQGGAMLHARLPLERP